MKPFSPENMQIVLNAVTADATVMHDALRLLIAQLPNRAEFDSALREATQRRLDAALPVAVGEEYLDSLRGSCERLLRH